MSQRSLRSTTARGLNYLNQPPKTPTPSMSTANQVDPWGREMHEERMGGYRSSTYAPSEDYPDPYYSGLPPATPTPMYYPMEPMERLDLPDLPTLADGLEEEDSITAPFDLNEKAPNSASSLDTPQNSPTHEPEVVEAVDNSNCYQLRIVSAFNPNALIKGPNLSEESDSDGESVAAITAAESNTKVPDGSSSPSSSLKSDRSALARKRKTSSSPEAFRNKKVKSAAKRRSRRRTREPWATRSRSSSSSSSEDPQPPPTPCPTIEPSVSEPKRRNRTDSKSSLDQPPPTPNFSMDSILYSDRPSTPTPFIPHTAHSDFSLADYPLPPTPSLPRRVSPGPPPTPSMPRRVSPGPPPTPSMPRRVSPGLPPTPSMPRRVSPGLPPTPSMPRRVSPGPPPTPSMPRRVSPGPPPTPSMPRRISPALPPSPSMPRRISSDPPPTPTPVKTKVSHQKVATKKPAQCLSVARMSKDLTTKEKSWMGDTALEVQVPRDSEPTPGTIKSLELRNVMSHTDFKREWHKSMNFIIGENGSGKSAILTGIVAGLGGKAYDTGRANSIRDIITNGQNQAKIKIVLHNHPSKLYGNDITIVRTMSREGSSKYQIKDANGNLRRLDRQELNLVLSKLNIQVNNPLAILHQEMSRNFLRTNDPTDLYNYFYRALLLNTCESMLKKAQQDLDSTGACLEKKKQLLEDLRHTEADLFKQVKFIESLGQTKERLSELDNKFFWAVVKESEGELKAVKEDLEKASKLLTISHQEFDLVNNQLSDVKETLSTFEQRHQSLSDEKVAKSSDYEQQRKNWYTSNRFISDLQTKIKNAFQTIRRQETTRESIQTKVNENRINVEKSFENKKKQNDSKIAQLQVDEMVIKAEFDEGQKRHSQHLEKLQVAEKTAEDLQYKINELEKKRNEGRKEIRDMKQAEYNQYDAYGQEMSKLMRRVKEMVDLKQFIHPPRGPLGSCFTVAEEKWVALIESILEPALCSFAVDNTKDQDLLRQLIDEVYRNSRNRHARRPNICLMKFQHTRIDVRKGHAYTPNHPTILQKLEISDPVVYNWLIDNQRVERLLMFENYAVACDFMKNRHNVPETTMKGYSLDAYSFCPDPNFRAMVQWARLKPPRFLKVAQQENNNSTMDNLVGEVHRLERELEGLNGHRLQIKAHVDAHKIDVQLSSRQLKKVTDKHNMIRSELRTLQTYCIPDVPNVESWMDELETINMNIQSKSEERDNLEKQLKEERDRQSKCNLKILEAEVKRLQSDQDKLLEQKSFAEGKVFEIEREVRKREAVVNSTRKIHIDIHKKVKEAESEFKRKYQEALQRCPQITDLQRSSQEYRAEYEAMNDEWLKNQKKVFQRNQTVRKHQNAKTVADNVQGEIEVIDMLVKLAQPNMKLHHDHFQRKIVEYGIGIRTVFRALIRDRNYSGDFAISHEDTTLMCYVSLDKCSEDRAKQNMDLKNGQQVVANKKGIQEFASSMSGGERSFTTICFLISCWQLMDMPFFILDEFDVFMDALNRKTSQEFLMKVAESKPHSQFFLFTPLALDITIPENSTRIKLIKNQASKERQEDEVRKPMIRSK